MEYPRQMLFAERVDVLSATPSPQNYFGLYSMAKRMARLARGVYRLLSAWNRRWKSRQELAELDTVRLDDIGITRAQALTEARLPFWREGGRKRYDRKWLVLLTAIQRAADRRRLTRSYHRNYTELLSLDDNLISDIGVHNGDFRILARQAAIAEQIRHARQRRRGRPSRYRRISMNAPRIVGVASPILFDQFRSNKRRVKGHGRIVHRAELRTPANVYGVGND